MNITSNDIAKIAGVSRGTVDRALHRRKGVSQKMADRILEIAEEHGYKPNVIGRALSTGKTHTIGVVLFDLEHSFFSEVFTAVENRAREDHYLPLPALSHLDSNNEKESVRRLAERGVDGLLLISVRKDKEYTKYISKLDIPAVSFANRISDSIPHIWIDEKAAGDSSVSHITSKKYREIIYYAPPLKYKKTSNIQAQIERHSGVIRAAKTHRISCTTVTDQNCINDIIRKKPEKHTAILGCTDEHALFCMNECRSVGLTPGEDIGIMGFDNLNILKYITPKLTTVDFSREKLAESAFEMILDLINGKSVEDRTITHSLIQGETI